MSLPLLVLIGLALVFLQSRLYRRFGMSRLSYERTFSTTACRAGDEIEMIERIANDKWLPLPWLRLEATMPASLRFGSQGDMTVREGIRFQNHRSVFALKPYTEIIRRHKVRCLRRGCFDLETAVMTTGDLFGFAQHSTTLRVGLRLLVYPVPAPVEDLPLPWRGWQGEMVVRRLILEDPFVKQGVREYRPGDPMRSIHWKATARTGKLQVHQLAPTANRKLSILLNIEVNPDMWSDVTDPDLIEWGIRCCLTLVEQCLAQGIPTGFACNGHSIDRDTRTPVHVPPSGGQQQYEKILEEMAKLQLRLSLPFAGLMELAQQEETDFILVTAHTANGIQDRIAALEGRGASVCVLPLMKGEGEAYAAV